MRIAWFTPFHRRSAIARVGQLVTAELAELADVEIWTSDGEPLLETSLPVVGYKPGSRDLDALRERDAIVYNLGNHLENHGDIHAVATRHPGVVVLHDRALHHLFADMWLATEEPEVDRYVEGMRRHYGSQGMRSAVAYLNGERTPAWESDEDLVRFPLYEESLANAIGAITHSREQAAAITRKWLGPVAALRLPCLREDLRRPHAPAASGPKPERLRLLTVGHVNPNKHVDAVIEMLAAHPALAGRVEYRVVGPVGDAGAYEERLRALLARAEGLVEVTMKGWVSDEELESEMAGADIFVNLRYPNIEGASASLIKQLSYGRPVVCFDSGCFAELPADAVAAVPVGDLDAVASVLGELVGDPRRREAIGVRARRFVADSTGRAYAEGALELIERARRAAPALGLIDRVATELGLMQVDEHMPTFQEVAGDFARVLTI